MLNPTKQMETRPHRAQHAVPRRERVFERFGTFPTSLLVCYWPLASRLPGLYAARAHAAEHKSCARTRIDPRKKRCWQQTAHRDV